MHYDKLVPASIPYHLQAYNFSVASELLKMLEYLVLKLQVHVDQDWEKPKEKILKGVGCAAGQAATPSQQSK